MRRGLSLAVGGIALVSVVGVVALFAVRETDGGGARPQATAGGAPPASEQGLDAQLRDAAWANDVERARGLIEACADVNAVDGTTQPAYLIATSEGYSELLELTLGAGADVDALDSWNGTGLIRAAERGHHLVVGRLLRAGIDKDHVNRIGYQAIHEAVWCCRRARDRAGARGGRRRARPSVGQRRADSAGDGA